jgi:Peptidase family M41
MRPALWAADLELPSDTRLQVSLNVAAGQLVVSTLAGQEPKHQTQLPVHLDIDRIKRRASSDFRALLAVHEAGHGLAYACLFGHAPQEVKINVASFEGGYNSYVRLKAQSRQNVLDRICVSLAGRAAETLVFGPDACSSGSYGDIKQATEAAAQFVRHYGFGTRLSHTDNSHDMNDNVNTDIEPTNVQIEMILAEQFERACALMRQRSGLLMQIVQELMANGQIAPASMVQLLSPHIPVRLAADDVLLVPYAEHLKVFELQQELMQRAAAPRLKKERSDQRRVDQAVV